jgi:uncharacterized lipoprotein YddW (UPF0748 family)
VTYEEITGIGYEEAQDHLSKALSLGSQHNMDVFAWFEYGFAIHHKKLKSRSPLADIAEKTKLTKGFANSFLWLDPTNAEALTLMEKLLMDCVEGYNSLGLAGIQLDDHFGPP